jgi:5-methyltetrahydropteroyltriglutamate--homocysteine methyltransferase
MLRPPYLAPARERLRAGAMQAEELRELEDRAVRDAIAVQERAGLDVITDGEMRRTVFFDHFVAGIEGMSPLPGARIKFRNDQGGELDFQIPFSVTERIRARRSPAVAEFSFARSLTARRLKVTVPSPMIILGFWSEHSRDAYPDPFALAEDAAEVVRGWVSQLAEAGCDYIQIDAPELAECFADEQVRVEYEARGISAQRFMAEGPELVNRAAAVDGVRKVMHLCKGNGAEHFIARGSYEDFSRVVFAKATNFDAFHFEFDDERSGGFEPLANLPDDKVAILGLVSTRRGELESASELRRRIGEAARFHPKEQLALATQCGFASASETAAERPVDEPLQAAKLALIAEVAHDVWGQ